MGTTTTKAGEAIQLPSFALDTSSFNLHVYVQNVGQGDVKLSNIYINDYLIPSFTPDSSHLDYMLKVDDTADLTVGKNDLITAGVFDTTGQILQNNGNLKIKVATTDGTFMTATGKVTSSTGGGSNTNALTAPTVTAGSASIIQGSTSSLTSSAVTTGTAPYTYQWLQEVPSGSTFTTITGATTSSYSFVTTGTTTTGVWSFELRVTDSASSTVTSAPATVTVNTATASPTVAIVPTGSFTMDVGQPKTFTATASGGSGTIHYQWYVGAGPVGTDSSSYTYTASGSSASITCKVTDSASPPVTSPASNAVTITVNGAMSTPSITPVGPLTTMHIGDTQTFTLASVSGGTGTKTNQWYLDGVAVSGQTGATYVYIATSGSHTVYVIVTDSASTPATVQSNTVAITVTAAPSITISPTYGSSNTVVTVSGSGFAANSAITIKFNGNTVKTTTSTSAGAIPSGVTFTVSNSGLTWSNSYTVTATDASSNSASATYRYYNSP
jgi:hypothetical protein